MLPASRTSNPPHSFWILYRTSILASLALAGYALLVGVGLAREWIPVERAYFLMALPCLAPALWYGYSFLKGSDSHSDFGLLLSAAGWALFAFGFLIKDSIYRNVEAAARSGLAADPENAPVATLCFVLAFACLIAGAALSLSRRE